MSLIVKGNGIFLASFSCVILFSPHTIIHGGCYVTDSVELVLSKMCKDGNRKAKTWNQFSWVSREVQSSSQQAFLSSAKWLNWKKCWWHLGIKNTMCFVDQLLYGYPPFLAKFISVINYPVLQEVQYGNKHFSNSLIFLS